MFRWTIHARVFGGPNIRGCPMGFSAGGSLLVVCALLTLRIVLVLLRLRARQSATLDGVRR